MTKKEARAYIKEWLKDECLDSKDREALTVAVEDLKQEPYNDKIIEWKKDFKEYIDFLSMPRDDYKGIMEYIDELCCLLR